MAVKVTYDYTNKLFIAKAGVTEIDVQVDLYSDWKEDCLDDTFFFGMVQPLRTTGGDDLGGGKIIAPYFFFLNGWKLRPDEANHTLTISGNWYDDPAGAGLIVPTVGAYTVNVILERGVDVLGVDSANVTSIWGSTEAAEKLSISATGIVKGTVVGAGTVVSCVTDLTEATNDHYNNRVILWTTGNLTDQIAKVTDYIGGSKTLVYSQVTEGPADGDEFILI